MLWQTIYLLLDILASRNETCSFNIQHKTDCFPVNYQLDQVPPGFEFFSNDNQFIEGKYTALVFLRRKLGKVTHERRINRADHYREDEKTGWNVEYAMRYEEPSIERALHKFKKNEINKIYVISLYPHNAMATTVTTELETATCCRE